MSQSLRPTGARVPDGLEMSYREDQGPTRGRSAGGASAKSGAGSDLRVTPLSVVLPHSTSSSGGPQTGRSRSSTVGGS
jgi:hypothetical protein